jgi:polyribonucleotide nucleotidyltransferase
VEAAVALVREVIELGPVVALKMQTVKMIIPHDKVPLVIGQRGITAKEMMRRSGCKIHVNETVDVDDNCFIELTGTSEQLAAAQELISHVLEHGTKALGKRFHK